MSNRPTRDPLLDAIAEFLADAAKGVALLIIFPAAMLALCGVAEMMGRF